MISLREGNGKKQGKILRVGEEKLYNNNRLFPRHKTD